MKSVVFATLCIIAANFAQAANPYLVCGSNDVTCKQEQANKCQQVANACWQKPYSEATQKECLEINNQCSEIWTYTGAPAAEVTSKTGAKTLPRTTGKTLPVKTSTGKTLPPKTSTGKTLPPKTTAKTLPAKTTRKVEPTQQPSNDDYFSCASDDWNCKTQMSDKCYAKARECWAKPYTQTQSQECNDIQQKCAKIWN